MKRIKYLLVIVIFPGVYSSCKKDFLNVDDNRILNRQSYVKDLNSMEQFVKGIYVSLNSDMYEHGVGAAYPDLVADNLKPLPVSPAPGSGTQSLASHYTWTQQANESGLYRVREGDLNMNHYWAGAYFAIRSCNFVIEEIDKYKDEDPLKASNLKGQAYAIRALIHFRLVNIFAQAYKYTPDASHPGIPYITSSDITDPFTRQSVGEVYSNLIPDLNNAIQLLPAGITDTRVMNKSAAKGILARIYLFREDYVNAKNLAIEIVNQSPLMTIGGGYPDDIFKKKNASQTEVLFQLTPINLASSLDRSRFIGFYLRGSSILYNATSDIANILKENVNDIRSTWVNNVSGNWNVTKFPTGVATSEIPAPVAPETSYYPPVIRSSEMFLTVAEASAKTGDENTARSYLDSIRKRADPSIASITATGSSLLDSIYKERRKELAFEGLRMYDLQRWKSGVHRTDVHPSYSTAKDLPYPSNKAIAPIPLQDTKLAGLIQNDSY